MGRYHQKVDKMDSSTLRLQLYFGTLTMEIDTLMC